MAVFHRNRTENTKICMETQKTLNSQTHLEKEDKAGGIRHLNFQLYYKAMVIKTVLCWHKNRQIDQWNRIKRQEINPHICGHLTYNKAAKNLQ